MPVAEDHGHSVIHIAGRQRHVVKGKPIDDYDAELNKSIARHPAKGRKKKDDESG